MYVFRIRGLYEEYQGSNKTLPWCYYLQLAFTLDHTGANLPDMTLPWKYYGELPPDHKPVGLAFSSVDNEALMLAIDTKGWYIARGYLSASSFRKPCDYPAAVSEPPAIKRPRAEGDISEIAESIIAELRK